MPRPAALHALQPDDLAALDAEMAARHFADIDGIVDWLSARGYEISRAAVGRHNLKLKRRLEAVRASTEAARQIAAAAPDDSDLRSSAVISMVQTEMFDALLALQDADEQEDVGDRIQLMAKAMRGLKDMTLASISQKKFAIEQERRIRAEAATSAEVAAKKAGVSADGIAAIRAAITAEMRA